MGISKNVAFETLKDMNSPDRAKPVLNQNEAKDLVRVKQREAKKSSQHPIEHQEYVSRVISVDAVRKTTKGGRVNRFRALVVCGNGYGAAGFALGKAETVRKAIQKAYAGSKRRWVAMERAEDNGLYHDVLGKKNNTRVLLRRCKPYNGITAGGVVRGIMEAFGIDNVTSKVIGRTTKSSVVYATFDALSRHQTPREVSEKRGRKIIRSSRWPM